MERARSVSGSVSVSAHCLRMVAGRRSGPVALEVSSERSSCRVCRVRRSAKPVVGAGAVVGTSSWLSGTVGRVNFVEKVTAKVLALSVGSWVHVPFASLSGGDCESRGVVVQESSVDPPPFFGVARELFKLRLEVVGVGVVGSGECVVGVLACVVVVRLSFL